jgi:hypothetical protein
MTHHTADTDSATTTLGPILDHESLRDRDAVPFHEDRDVVDAEVIDQLQSMDDLAGVGITNDDGDLLFRRLTDTCSWKIPVATVDPEEDFAAEIVEHVRETIGFSLELDGIAGVWDIRLRTADGERTASRAFVTFSASPAAGHYDLAAATPAGEPVEAAGWFGDLPSEADEIPGTGVFLE